jgi:uncharacterized membrane protein
MNVTSLFTTLPIFFLLLKNWELPITALPFLVVSSVAEVLYFLSLGKAYELGDLSIVYPLARSSPLFLVVLTVIVLNESISAYGWIGIASIIIGIYVIHMEQLSIRDFLKPLISLRSRASQYALLTALCTSVYSISDKLGVTAVSPIAYALWLDIFITLFLTPIVLVRQGWTSMLHEFKNHGFIIIGSGFLMRIGYILVLIAMSFTQVSYILSVRQVSIVIGVALGVRVLSESYGKIRLLGSSIILFGIVILGLMT